MFFPTLISQVFPRLCEKRSIVAAETGKETPLKRLYGKFFWPASQKNAGNGIAHSAGRQRQPVWEI